MASRRANGQRSPTGQKPSISGTERDRKFAALQRRDGPDCQICKRPIDYTLPRNHRMAWSFDHHPTRWIDGGTWRIDNLRIVHQHCNTLLNDQVSRYNHRLNTMLERLWGWWTSRQYIPAWPALPPDQLGE